MAIKPLNTHYSMENPATVYDEEALTTLELVGRTTAKVNEVVESQNDLAQGTLYRLDKMENTQIPATVKKEVQEHINSGRFDAQVDKYAGEVEKKMSEYHSDAISQAAAVETRLNARMDTFTKLPNGSTTGDAELADLRVDANGTEYDSAGTGVRTTTKNLRASVDTFKAFIAKLHNAEIITHDFIVGSCAGYQGQIQASNKVAIACPSIYDFESAEKEMVVCVDAGFKVKLYIFTAAGAYTYETVECLPGVNVVPNKASYKYRIQIEKEDESAVTETEIPTLSAGVTMYKLPIYHENNWYFYLTDFGKFTGYGSYNGMALHHVSIGGYKLKAYSTASASGIVEWSMEDIVSLFPDYIVYNNEQPYLKMGGLVALCFNMTNKNLVARTQGKIQHDDIVLLKWGASENILPGAGILATKYLADTNQLTQTTAATDGETTANIPEYWEAATDEAISKITAYQNEIGFDGAVVGFITDTHIRDNMKNSGLLMSKVTTDCHIPVYVDGGDTVTGFGITPASEIIADLHTADKLFNACIDKRLRVVGNHDMVYGTIDSYDSELKDSEFKFNFYRHALENGGCVYGPNGTYFYKDLELSKIRIICLDSECFGPLTNSNGQVLNNAFNKIWTHMLGSEQLAWLANEALNLPASDWHCMVFNHIPVMAASDNAEVGTYLSDIDLLKGVLNAFKNKGSYTGSVNTAAIGAISVNANFANHKGEIIGCFAGHVHSDLMTDVGFVSLTTANDSVSVSNNASAPAKERGTTTEHVMDFICVNKATRTVNIVRLGAGADRSFTY